MSGKTEAKRRESILRAALAVFDRRDFHEVTMEEVAQAAGVAKGTVYLYFKSKEELYGCALVDWLREAAERIARRVAEEPTPLSQLRLLIRLHLQEANNHRHLDRLLSCRSGEGPRGLLERLEGVAREYVRFIAEIIRRGCEEGQLQPVDPCLAASALIGLLSGASRYYQLREGRIPEGAAGAVESLFLEGLRPRPGQPRVVVVNRRPRG